MLNVEKFAVQVPYNTTLMEVFKTLPQYEYDQPTKSWLFPKSLLYLVAELIEPFYIDIARDLRDSDADFSFNQMIRYYLSNRSDPDIFELQIKNIIKKIVLPKGLSLYPHQVVGVAFIQLCKGRAFIGDVMGLGKTIQILAWLSFQPKEEKVVWITKKLLTTQAQQEINKWLPNKTIQIVKTGKQEINTDADITIISYDLVPKQNANLIQLGYKILILDEMTMIQNPDTQRTIAVMELSQGISKIIGMSGTPLRGKPINFWSFLNMLEPTLFPTQFDFGRRYCDGQKGSWGWDFNGSSNENTLNMVLKTMMIRRSREEAGVNMPPKTRKMVKVNGSKKFWTEYNELDARIQKAKLMPKRDKPFEALGLMQKARTLVGVEKVNSIKEITEKYLDAGEKIVIYVHSYDLNRQLTEQYSKRYETVSIKSGMSAKAVSKAQTSFNDGDAQVMILSTIAGGSGLNLNSADFGFFVERQWVVDDEEQAEDRIYRLGKKNPVTITYLHLDNTMDDYMDKLAERKRDSNRKVLDGDREQSAQMEILNMWE